MLLKTETKTPKKQPLPSTSFYNNNNNQRELRSKYHREKGQGDGFDNTTGKFNKTNLHLKYLFKFDLFRIFTI